MASDAFKAKGNAAFAAGNHEEAIKHFTEGIAVDPSNHVLYSNRSASYASLQQYDEALADADKVVELKPDWPKGYSRLGAAAIGLGNTKKAKAAYEKGLEVDPANEGFKTELENLKRPARGAGGGFFGPAVMAKLAMDRNTAPLLSQPDFMRMIHDINSNPNSMSKYLGDDRFQMALQVGLGMNMMSGDQFKRQQEAGGPTASGSSAPASDPKPAPRPKQPEPEPEPEPMEEEPVDEEQAKLRQHKADAQKEKEAGNAAYKARKFEEAIRHYDRAIELDDSDISFLTNRRGLPCNIWGSNYAAT